MSPADTTPDAALIDRVRAGDDAAFGTLFDRYAGEIRARVERRLPDRLRRKVSVADILQESQMVAFRLLPEFEDRGPNSVPKWLHRIAQLEVRSAIGRYAGTAKRDVAREVTRADRRDTRNYAAGGPTPSQEAIARELSEAIDLSLEALPSDYRTVLQLVMKQQCSLREAAGRMNRSREAVKKLYGRAVTRFTADLRRRRGEKHA